MSYVDLEVSENNNTITPSRRSHRSRAKLLAEASLSMSRNVSSQISSPLSTITNDTNHDVRLRVPSFPQPPSAISQLTNPSPPCVTTRVTCASSRDHFSKIPPPVLTNLDPDDDTISSSPPRPNHYHQSSLEPVVAFNGCTVGNSGTPSVPPTPHQPNPNSPKLSLPTPICQSSPNQRSP
jgi:hypothetical protein